MNREAKIKQYHFYEKNISLIPLCKMKKYYTIIQDLLFVNLKTSIKYSRCMTLRFYNTENNLISCQNINISKFTLYLKTKIVQKNFVQLFKTYAGLNILNVNI